MPGIFRCKEHRCLHECDEHSCLIIPALNQSPRRCAWSGRIFGYSNAITDNSNYSTSGKKPPARKHRVHREIPVSLVYSLLQVVLSPEFRQQQAVAFWEDSRRNRKSHQNLAYAYTIFTTREQIRTFSITCASAIISCVQVRQDTGTNITVGMLRDAVEKILQEYDSWIRRGYFIPYWARILFPLAC